MPNRLAREPSPYLRQHADNPVDWYPWGPEALERSKNEDKPILLSVGYSACHWCHVMAHESFEDDAIASLMNQWFVNVKIDREERPDLDQLYQGVVQLMGRGGGWPLTVFLTPDLVPFFGGTYFPSDDKYGMPGFPKVLAALADAWKNERKKVLDQAAQFKEGLVSYTSHGLDSASGALNGDDVVTAAVKLESRVDRRHGGFGKSGPKFPNPMNVQVLLRGWRRSRREELKSAALLTLEKMALGGVYDQLGGGFHRYSVDERWLVPHFEKMLYDNAQLLHLYSEAQQVEPKALWEKTVRETVGYLQREMTSPDGAFYAAQDADSEGEEGRFFVWRPEEIDAVVGAELGLRVRDAFHVTAVGNFEHGTTVLEAVKPLDGLDEARAKLLAERSKRTPPGRDDKVLAGWNGLAIRGLALASRVFSRPEWAAMAERAADFVLTKMRAADGSLHRSWQNGGRLAGMLEDYGDVCSGLTALYQATFNPRWLEAAEALADLAYEKFWDEGQRAYSSAPKGTSDLVIQTWALHDNAFPSGASTLTEAQVTLGALTGRERHLERAGRYLERLKHEMLENPLGYGHLLLAADAFVDGAAEVTVVGEAPALVKVLSTTYAPTVALCVVGPEVPAVLAEQATVRLNGPSPAAYLCRNRACGLPAKTADELRAQLFPTRQPSP
ncbi:MAG: thioredoxin domain-containing protein [Myxococcaceae bacterium]|nr:thioredoxin domain-containing protein [Myxococcaceae bacterium]